MRPMEGPLHRTFHDLRVGRRPMNDYFPFLAYFSGWAAKVFLQSSEQK
jgi:hypothetical protein